MFKGDLGQVEIPDHPKEIVVKAADFTPVFGKNSQGLWLVFKHWHSDDITVLAMAHETAYDLAEGLLKFKYWPSNWKTRLGLWFLRKGVE